MSCAAKEYLKKLSISFVESACLLVVFVRETARLRECQARAAVFIEQNGDGPVMHEQNVLHRTSANPLIAINV